jgi:hypothetical protein
MAMDVNVVFGNTVVVLRWLSGALAIYLKDGGNTAMCMLDASLHATMYRVNVCDVGYSVKYFAAASFSSERLALCALTCCISLWRSAGCTCRHTTPCAVPGGCAFLA